MRSPLGRVLLSLVLGLASLALLELFLIEPLIGSRAAPSSARWAHRRAQVVVPSTRQPIRDLAPAVGQPDPVPSATLSVPRPATVTLDHHVLMPLVPGSGWMTETRALWVTRWNYTSITDVQTLMERAAGARFNMVLFQVRGAADAFYTPGPEPWAAKLSGTLGKDPGWDPLQAAIEAAHAHDLELHAWVNVYPVWLGDTAPPKGTDPEHFFWQLSHAYTWDDWRSTNISGTPMLLGRSNYIMATPALTDVVDRVVTVTEHIVSHYEVDGVHLDLVRYHGADHSYDRFSNAGYEAAQAAEEDLTRAEWQRRQVTELVNRVYSETILPRPELRLSAAVWPIYRDDWGWGYTAGYSDYYQDSQDWMARKYIDAIMPMLYTRVFISDPEALTPTQFSLVAADFLAHDGGRHALPGISAEHLDFAGIAERIAIARNLGAPGHAIFSAGTLDEKAYWDDLAGGPYATEAVIPPMTWREASAAGQ